MLGAPPAATAAADADAAATALDTALVNTPAPPKRGTRGTWGVQAEAAVADKGAPLGEWVKVAATAAVNLPGRGMMGCRGEWVPPLSAPTRVVVVASPGSGRAGAAVDE